MNECPVLGMVDVDDSGDEWCLTELARLESKLDEDDDGDDMRTDDHDDDAGVDETIAM